MAGRKGSTVMKNYYLLLVFLLSFLSLRLFAQEATEETPQGWPIVERCVGEPIAPPTDWSFQGTILATGWAGIHGINAEWETPRILIFRDDWYTYPQGYGLSPNGEWYAVIQYNLKQGVRAFVFTYGLKVYSTSDRAVSYFYPVEPSEETYIFWLDSEHLIYRDYENAYRINPFSGEIELYSGTVSDKMLIAPDTKFAFWSSYNDVNWYLEDLENNEVVFQTSDGYPSAITLDSQFIVFYKRQEFNQENYTSTASLVLLNTDGELVDTIYRGDIFTQYYSGIHALSNDWSQDGRYYAFAPAINSEGRTGTLHLADMQERIVINTCVSTQSYGLSWLSTENKLVFAYPEYGQQPLQILDLDLWQVYLTNQYHNGNIIGWRAD